jgi:outer membrane lipoprotein carrier protein
VRRVRLAAGLALLVLSAQAGAASGTPVGAAGTVLGRFLDGLTTLRAEFSQTVVDASGRNVGSGHGSLLVHRPGRFRWEYQPVDGGAQLLVADGTNLWFYDRELQQATVKPAAAALSATPVVLLSGSAADLDAAFAIVDARAGEGLSWVEVTPRSATAEFSRAALGFRDRELRRLVIHDRLNQTVTLEFTRSDRAARVGDAELRFSPPAGVDLIGTAQALP